MCCFLSALVLRNGDVLTHPMLDSHSDLVKYFKLPDTTAYHQHFAKVELVPDDWMNVATWRFSLDDSTAPSWWDDVAGPAEAALRARAERMILRGGNHELIVDGCWIVGGNAKIRDVRSGRIVHVQDSAQITNVGGSAQITDVWGSAQITNVGGSAQITDVWDSAQITNVGGSAQITDVWGSAQITNVGGSEQITDGWDLAQITNVGVSVLLDASAKRHKKITNGQR